MEGLYRLDGPSNPFNESMKYGEPEGLIIERFTCVPHTIWITFLHDRFKCDHLNNIENVLLYAQLFNISCRHKIR